MANVSDESLSVNDRIKLIQSHFPPEQVLSNADCVRVGLASPFVDTATTAIDPTPRLMPTRRSWCATATPAAQGPSKHKSTSPTEQESRAKNANPGSAKSDQTRSIKAQRNVTGAAAFLSALEVDERVPRRAATTSMKRRKLIYREPTGTVPRGKRDSNPGTVPAPASVHPPLPPSLRSPAGFFPSPQLSIDATQASTVAGTSSAPGPASVTRRKAIRGISIAAPPAVNPPSIVDELGVGTAEGSATGPGPVSVTDQEVGLSAVTAAQSRRSRKTFQEAVGQGLEPAPVPDHNQRKKKKKPIATARARKSQDATAGQAVPSTSTSVGQRTRGTFLKEQDLELIREMADKGLTKNEAAAAMNCSPSTIATNYEKLTKKKWPSKRSRNLFTTDEDEIIRQALRDGEPVGSVAKRLPNRTITTLKTRRNTLCKSEDLPEWATAQKEWSDSEDGQLRDLYNQGISDDAIARTLGRTEEAIHLRRGKLRLVQTTRRRWDGAGEQALEQALKDGMDDREAADKFDRSAQAIKRRRIGMGVFRR